VEGGDVARLLEELRKLNANLEVSHRDTLSLLSGLKDMRVGVKGIYILSKQINVLNQIMLSVSKRAGTSGMVQNLLEGIVKLASGGR
jgi:hypothetical protein